MSNTETLSKYELVFIVDSHLSADEKEAVVKDASGIIEKSGGKVLKTEVWMEKQRLAFPIKKKQDGTYYLVNFESQGDAPGKMEPLLKLNEKILRFTVINLQ